MTIPESFPDPRVYDSYVNPVINDSLDHFSFGKPDVDKLSCLMQEKVGWSHEKTTEILLPVIQQMNNQSFHNLQSRIDQFFPADISPSKFGSIRIQKVIKDWE